jgi:L-iditol 2-dehydrogenase
MRSAFLVGPKKFELREVADPTAPPDGLVLQVEACGVCGSDLRRWREGPAIPYVPGHEVVGVVTEVGPALRSDVPHYAVGDRLAVAPDIHCGHCYYCARELYNLCDNLTFVGISPEYPGGFAERMALSAEVLTNGIVHPMPAGLSFLAGSLSEPCSSVLACHHKAGTSLDDTVVVIGAGPIGCLHIAIARARGARVIVSQRSATRREMVRRFYPDAVLDPTAEDVVARVRELTGGVGADLVICANPVAETQAQAIEMVRKGGRVVLFGGLPKANPMVTLDANRIHYGDIELVGAFSYHPIFHAQALDVLDRGIIPVDLLVTHTFRLEQVAEAFETADSGKGLKVVVSRTPSRLASRT